MSFKLLKLVLPFIMSMTNAVPETCTTAADRLKTPKNFLEWIEASPNTKWTDTTFSDTQMLYWTNYVAVATKTAYDAAIVKTPY
jgi:hypothetical protein